MSFFKTLKMAYGKARAEPLRHSLEQQIAELESLRIKHRILTIQHQAEVDCCVATINLLNAELLTLQKPVRP